MWPFRSKRKTRDKNAAGTPTNKAPAAAATPIDAVVTASSSSSLHENPYSKYGLASPRKVTKNGHKSISVEQAVQNIKNDGRKVRKLFKKGGDDAKMLVFLYGRRFMARASKKNRVEKVLKMVQNKDSAERLLQVLLADGDNDLWGDRSYRRKYAEQVVALGRYFEQDTAFGFLTDMSEVDYFLRFQKSGGNCFLHAPCVLASYLAQKSGADNPFPVDVSKYVRHSFSDTQLYNYVVKDEGGYAQDILFEMVRIVGKDSEDKGLTMYGPYDVRHDPEFDLESKLKNRGPALVHNFDVHKKFQNASVAGLGSESKLGFVQFDGKSVEQTQATFLELAGPTGEELEGEISSILAKMAAKAESQKGQADLKPENILEEETLEDDSQVSEGEASLDSSLDDFLDDSHAFERDGGKNTVEGHAMILIGGRLDGKKRYLLFQNWWENMPFVEISDDYFHATNAQLTFVAPTVLPHFHSLSSTNTTSFHSSTNGTPVADSNNLDKAESTRYSTLQRDRSLV